MTLPTLKELLDDYRTALDLLKEEKSSEKVKTLTVEEGKVYRVEREGAPNWLLVVEKEGDYCLVSPMTFAWELATKYDVLVKFPHVLRDNWIVQLDLSGDVPVSVLRGAVLEGELNGKDFELIKRALKENASVPPEKKGRGYEDSIHKEFKELEYERHKWLYRALLSSLEEGDVIGEEIYSKLLSLKEKYLAAATGKSVIKLPFGEAIFDRENRKAVVVLNEDHLDKTGELYIELPGERVILFKGKLQDFELENVDEKLFGLFEYLKVGIENGKSS